ncbi:MAG: hypothetical protein COY40_06765 [Alphaproteobacteria bacterium CG_4_10_14_0_8_um_filter_53_9]|nr:MAG: hypothetical protein COY40_06765 [Alphaproteobacteria bacterium CG_4_10_14_0_8_um_filter_53_9]
MGSSFGGKRGGRWCFARPSPRLKLGTASAVLLIEMGREVRVFNTLDKKRPPEGQCGFAWSFFFIWLPAFSEGVGEKRGKRQDKRGKEKDGRQEGFQNGEVHGVSPWVGGLFF